MKSLDEFEKQLDEDKKLVESIKYRIAGLDSQFLDKFDNAEEAVEALRANFDEPHPVVVLTAYVEDYEFKVPDDLYLLKKPRFDSYEEAAVWAKAFLADCHVNQQEKFDELVEVAMRSYTASFNKERPAHLNAFDIERFVLKAYSNELNEEFIRERGSKDE